MESLLSTVTAKHLTDPPAPVPEPEEHSIATLTGDLGHLLISDSGEEKYVGLCGAASSLSWLTKTGASSVFSLFSPRGLAWIQRRTGSTRVATLVQNFRRAGPVWPVRLSPNTLNYN